MCDISISDSFYFICLFKIFKILRMSDNILLIIGLLFCLQGITGGNVRGSGKQLHGALCNIVVYYFVGLPVGVSLMLALNLGIIGKLLECVELFEGLISDATLNTSMNFLLFSLARFVDWILCVCLHTIFVLRHPHLQTGLEKSHTRGGSFFFIHI